MTDAESLQGWGAVDSVAEQINENIGRSLGREELVVALLPPKVYEVRIPGEPFAQPRAVAIPLMRGGKPVLKNGRPVIVKYDPREAKQWKSVAQDFMMNQRFPSGPLDGCLEGPVHLEVTAFFTCPKSDHRKTVRRERRWHTKTPDADNVLKAVKDAAKGVLWLDDSQVARETCTKIIAAQGEAPFVLLRVRELSLDEVPLLEGVR